MVNFGDTHRRRATEALQRVMSGEVLPLTHFHVVVAYQVPRPRDEAALVRIVNDLARAAGFTVRLQVAAEDASAPDEQSGVAPTVAP
jgi:hypothetical protein